MRTLLLLTLPAFVIACNGSGSAQPRPSVPAAAALASAPPVGDRLQLTDEAWKKRLSDAQFHVLRQAGTERPFTGALLKEKRPGVFVCGGCGAPLFDANTKFESGTGWPSFFAPIQEGRVEAIVDHSHGMSRTECAVPAAAATWATSSTTAPSHGAALLHQQPLPRLRPRERGAQAVITPSGANARIH
jgi:peptide-methionine (R)-S-oxide reductase